MIVNFRDGWLRDFFVEDTLSKKIPSDLQSRLFRKIQLIDDATTDQDLRAPPSNHFEKLQGDLGLLRKLVNGEWDDDFLVVPPGWRVVATHDERIIEAREP